MEKQVVVLEMTVLYIAYSSTNDDGVNGTTIGGGDDDINDGTESKWVSEWARGTREVV